MVARRYGHLTKKESSAALHKVGAELYDTLFSEANLRGNVEETGKIDAMPAIDQSQILLEEFRARKGREFMPSEGDALSKELGCSSHLTMVRKRGKGLPIPSAATKEAQLGIER